MTKDQRILQLSLLAQWHLHSASNGHCATRKVYKGDHRLTSDELRDDSMETAMCHIHEIDRVAAVPDEEWGC